MKENIGIGLAGFGTVGAGVFDVLQHQRDLLAERSGFQFEVRSIVVRDLKKVRDVAAPSELFTTSWRNLLKDPEIKIVVELLGGTTDAFEFIKAAIESGRIVVTGNKALLAEHGEEIFALAKKHDVPIFYEAAVAGGIPIIQSVRDAFVGNRIESIHGILNGTSNYILSHMQEAGPDYRAALAEATELGYAEADPTLDLNGGDVAHKAIILAALAYGFWVKPEAVRVHGIQEVTATDVFFARDFGYVIKLLATIRAAADHSIEVTVAPTLVSKNSVLASVNGAFNAIAVKGDLVGEALFYGKGAGRKPTASSVVGDLVEAAFALESPARHVGFSSHSLYGASKAPQDVHACYYLRVAVDDQPGVLAKIATIFGEAGIGIASVIQPKAKDKNKTDLVFMTHEAAYGKMSNALEKIKNLSCVKSTPVLFNVESV
ncbi:MAG: homoserine dehydrogenase [Verrucomicrobia bacterium]|nr:homoserine dehydrogenase [Verrucomicrobiota bacterium]